MKNWNELVTKLGFKSSSFDQRGGSLRLIDNQVIYGANLIGDILYVGALEYNAVDISIPFWARDFDLNNQNVESEIREYISSTTNDVLQTYEEASKIVHLIDQKGTKIYAIVSAIINK